MFNAITVADRIKALAGSALVILLALDTIDLPPVAQGIVAGAAALLLALGVKPLGPAS